MQFSTNSLHKKGKGISVWFFFPVIGSPVRTSSAMHTLVPNAFLSVAHKSTAAACFSWGLCAGRLWHPMHLMLQTRLRWPCLPQWHISVPTSSLIFGRSHLGRAGPTLRVVTKPSQENAASRALNKSFVINWNTDCILNREQIQAASEDNWEMSHFEFKNHSSSKLLSGLGSFLKCISNTWKTFLKTHKHIFIAF